MRRIGVLMKPPADDPDAPARVAAFAQRTGQIDVNDPFRQRAALDCRNANETDRNFMIG
jgi:hypothetical protein